jgi:hypothetical protein
MGRTTSFRDCTTLPDAVTRCDLLGIGRQNSPHAVSTSNSFGAQVMETVDIGRVRLVGR